MLQYDFENSIGYWVCLTSHALERALNEELAPHGITFPQCQVLAWLALEGELPQNQLAERARVEPPTLAGILDRMERDGWVRREPDPADRRKKIVRPTPRANLLWAKMIQCFQRVRGRATAGIPAEDLACTLRTLSAVLENLGTPAPRKEVVR